jgi:mannose-6-phosphate isomerase-like protein (cupin superfamily)
MKKTTQYSRRDLMQKLALSMLGISALPVASLAKNDEINSSNDTPKALLLKKDTGKTVNFGGLTTEFKLSKSTTNGLIGSDITLLKAGHLGAPPHLHKNIDEICYVLEGTVHILVGEEVFEVNADDWHLRPRGVMHTFWNASNETAKIIDMYLPAGHEEYLQDLAKLFENNQRPKPTDFADLEKKHDIVYFWPKLSEIMQKYKVHL